MNKYLSLALLASMIQFTPGVADEAVNANVAVNADGKVYVKPRAVRFMKDGIVVHTKDGAFITPSVSRDENGLFVQQADLEQAPAEMTKRKGCGRCNKNKMSQGQGRRFGQRQGNKGQGEGRRFGQRQAKRNFKKNRPHWKHKNKEAVEVVQPVEEEVVQIAE